MERDGGKRLLTWIVWRPAGLRGFGLSENTGCEYCVEFVVALCVREETLVVGVWLLLPMLGALLAAVLGG